MKKILYLLSILTILTACKKDKLEGEKSIFIGKWNWVYSTHTYSFCDGDPNTTVIIDPETDGNNYSMEFLEKGIVNFYENGNYLDTKRIVFDAFGNSCKYNEGSVSFSINLDNGRKAITPYFYGCINSDSLNLVKGFPHESIQEGCESYVSYFVKE